MTKNEKKERHLPDALRGIAKLLPPPDRRVCELAADELERSRDALRDVEIAERRIADALRDAGGA